MGSDDCRRRHGDACPVIFSRRWKFARIGRIADELPVTGARRVRATTMLLLGATRGSRAHSTTGCPSTVRRTAKVFRAYDPI